MLRIPMRAVFLVLAGLLVAACGNLAGGGAPVEPPSASEPQQAQTAAAPVSEPSNPPPVSPSASEVSLQILAPLDGAVVAVASVEVAGTAPAGTVISINDEIVLVGPEVTFAVLIPLEEGPNAIEIVASDVNGSESTQILTITYQP